jgi:hypothetical protein
MPEQSHGFDQKVLMLGILGIDWNLLKNVECTGGALINNSGADSKFT